MNSSGGKTDRGLVGRVLDMGLLLAALGAAGIWVQAYQHLH